MKNQFENNDNLFINNRIPGKQLMHCHGGTWGKIFGVDGGRSPEPISFTVDTFGNSLLYSMPHVLAEFKLLKIAESKNDFLKAAEDLWGKSVTRFFDDYVKHPELRYDKTNLVKPPSSTTVIGWGLSENFSYTDANLCRNIDMTIAVLSRTIGHIYFPGREPEYSWERLFENNLVIAEPLVSQPLTAPSVYGVKR